VLAILIALDAFNPDLIIEVGCNEGCTTAELCHAFPDVPIHAYDWTLGPTNMVPPQHHERPQTSRVGYHAREFPNATIYDQDRIAVPIHATRLGVFVDDDHSYNGARARIEELMQLHRELNRYKPASFLLLFHDVGKKIDWIGVDRALDELLPEWVILPGTNVGKFILEPTHGA
jgi:hypothetical protein